MAQKKPDPTKSPQRREAVRANIPPAAACLWLLGDDVARCEQATVLDVSATGGKIRTRTAYPVGVQVRCEFTLAGLGKLSLLGSVVRCEAHQELTGRYEIGVKFTMGPQQEQQLLRWIFRYMGNHLLIPLKSNDAGE